MITKAKITEHIALIEDKMRRANKKEISRLAATRAKLLAAIAFLDTSSPEQGEFMLSKALAKLDRYEQARLAILYDDRKRLTPILDAEYKPKDLRHQIEFLNYILLKNNDLLCGLLPFSSLA